MNSCNVPNLICSSRDGTAGMLPPFSLLIDALRYRGSSKDGRKS
jgi:hypothetical protein